MCINWFLTSMRISRIISWTSAGLRLKSLRMFFKSTMNLNLRKINHSMTAFNRFPRRIIVNPSWTSTFLFRNASSIKRYASSKCNCCIQSNDSIKYSIWSHKWIPCSLIFRRKNIPSFRLSSKLICHSDKLRMPKRFSTKWERLSCITSVTNFVE